MASLEAGLGRWQQISEGQWITRPSFRRREARWVAVLHAVRNSADPKEQWPSRYLAENALNPKFLEFQYKLEGRLSRVA